MAKRSATSKAEHVRQMIGQLGMETRSKDIIAKLAEKKIKVSPAQVSNIKSSMKTAAGSGGSGRRSAAGAPSIDDLIAAKKLADQLGGVAAAQRALDVLARLR